MSETSPPLTPTAPAPVPPSSDWIRWAVLALAVSSVAGIWMAWSTQKRVQSLELELVRRQQDSQGQAAEARLLARQAQDVSRETAARTALLETRLAEVALQRTQVEDLIKSLSLSRDENLVVDVEAGLRMSIQQSALTGSAEPMVNALQSADDRLARARQPRLDNVRRAVAKDLDRIRSTRVADLSSLVIRLDEAIRLVDDSPLIVKPVDDEGRARSRPPQQVKPLPRKSRAGSQVASKASEPDASLDEGSWSDQAWAWGRDLGKVVLDEALALVRITRIKQPEAMLIAPEQAFFLRENLKLRLLNARLALLSRQPSSAVSDLDVATAAIDKYFDPQSRKTQLLQNMVKDVGSQCTHTTLPRPDDTLAALAAVTGGR